MTWGKEKALTYVDFAGPRTADTITDSDNEKSQTKAQYEIIIDTSKDYCFSVHIEKDEIETRFAALYMRFHNNSGRIFQLILNTKTGETTVLGYAHSASGVIDLGTHWRFYMSVKAVDPLDVLLDIVIFPAMASVLPFVGLYEYWLTGSIIVSNAQLNEGLEPHTYTKTTTDPIDGAVQNLLTWSEEFERWYGIGLNTVESNTGSAPADRTSWPKETPLPRNDAE